MVGMAFDPFEKRLHAQSVALLDLGQDVFDDVSVLDRLPVRRLPSIPAPVDAPYCNTVDGIFAVGDDRNVPISRGNLESSLHRREFGALVGLSRAR